MSEPSDDELAERVAALETTLEELREEFEPSRGPLGLPRPPSPREVIRFTDEYAIPAAIAILQANVRTLQLLQAVLRAARGAPREDEVRERATDLGRTTVERVDRALADLQSAIEDADLPRNAEARSILEEAKGLNRDVRDALATSETGRTEAGSTVAEDEPAELPEGGGAEGASERPGSEVEIDVDAELASIKDELAEGDGSRDRADGDGRSGGDEDEDEHGNDE